MIEIILAALLADLSRGPAQAQHQVDEVARHILKRQIIEETREEFSRCFPTVDKHAACLYLAGILIEVAQRYGIRLVLQAGSASWKCVEDWQDDGVSPNFFSYVFEPDSSATRMLLAQGYLPELHAWAGDPERQEVVDITTGSWPQQALNLAGMKWPGERPPDWFWGGRSDLGDRALYRPDPTATLIAADYLRNIWGWRQP